MDITVKTDRRAAGIRGGWLAALLLAAASAVCGVPVAEAQQTPVASFDAIPPDSPPAVAGETARGDDAQEHARALSFSFRFAPWDDVLTKFADVAGLTLDLTEVPPGTFNYYDKGRYSPREAIDILNGYLLQRGFVLVRRDRFLVCVNLEKGIPANLIPLVTVDRLADYGSNELVSTILSHDGLDASLAASQVAQMQGPHGKVVAMNETNSLLVTDTAGNLRFLQRLLDEGAFKRRANGGTEPAFKSFALQHVRADETERLIRSMFGLPPAASQTPGSTDVSITTDVRTNRLFVAASSAKLTSIEQLVAAYDVADSPAHDTPRSGTTATRIVPLPNADVIVIGRALESLSPRIRVSTTHSARRSAAADAPPERPTPDKPEGEPAAAANPPAGKSSNPDGRDR